ncbi:hypothetical protein ACWD25_01955 [Streptomyces sp. NPDC002920]
MLETESGDRYEDPSEDHIFDKVVELTWPENTFFTIEGVTGGWYVVVSLLDDGNFEVEYRNPPLREHRIESAGAASDIAHDVIVWIAGIVRG